MTESLLEIRSVSKAYGATQALDNVSLHVDAGEIHAIVGENGAGKSSLINILSGVTPPDSGDLLLDGESIVLDTPHKAQRIGIATVHQELSLVDHLSVAENIFASRVPTRFGLVRWKVLARETRTIFQSLGIEINESIRTGELPLGARQLVEIAKALSLNSRLILFDEPTSALNAREKEALFELILTLKRSGITVIYISHHLDEVIRLADRVTVLRDGKVVAMHTVNAVTPQMLIREMVGRDISTADAARVELSGSPVLEVSGLSLNPEFREISFSLRAGEIVALAGLKGSGRGAVASTLAGLFKPHKGTITWQGKQLNLRSLRDAMRVGIGYVPSERKTEGLFLELSTGENIVAASLPRFSRAGLFDKNATLETARKHISRLHIKTRGAHERCGALSGGNQQKILIAKWLETQPRLLIVDEPTKGIDIAAKSEIHFLLRKLADGGAAIIFISSDLPETLTLADRVLVMHNGNLVADLAASSTNEREITALASGMMDRAA